MVEQEQRGVGRPPVRCAAERLDGRERVRRVLRELEPVDEPRRVGAAVALLDHHDEALAGADHLPQRRERLAGDRCVHVRQQAGGLDVGGDEGRVDVVLDEQRDAPRRGWPPATSGRRSSSRGTGSSRSRTTRGTGSGPRAPRARRRSSRRCGRRRRRPPGRARLGGHGDRLGVAARRRAHDAAGLAARPHVDEQGPHALVELLGDRVELFGDEPPGQPGHRHRVVRRDVGDLVEPPVAQLGVPVAAARWARGPRHRRRRRVPAGPARRRPPRPRRRGRRRRRAWPDAPAGREARPRRPDRRHRPAPARPGAGGRPRRARRTR